MKAFCGPALKECIFTGNLFFFEPEGRELPEGNDITFNIQLYEKTNSACFSYDYSYDICVMHRG